VLKEKEEKGGEGDRRLGKVVERRIYVRIPSVIM